MPQEACTARDTLQRTFTRVTKVCDATSRWKIEGGQTAVVPQIVLGEAIERVERMKQVETGENMGYCQSCTLATGNDQPLHSILAHHLKSR